MYTLVIVRRTILALLLGVWGSQGSASPSALCEEAAQYASRQTGVPLSILRAVTLAETGHTQPDNAAFDAWPWAVMSDMEGNWFPDQESAIAFVEDLVAQGKSNIDVGCFQLNIRWHAHAFPSVDAMFSPKSNALYAANFLNDLFQQTGNWRAAVGRYHSSDEVRAERYVRRLETIFDTHLAHTAPAFDAPETTAPERVATAYERFSLVSARGPLLQTPTRVRPLIGGTP